MNPWRPYPLLRPGISLFAGMAFALTGLFAWHIPEIVPVGLLVILFFQTLFPGRLVPFRFRWINGFLLNTALFVIGTQLPENRNVPGVPAGMNPPGTSALWVMRVCDPPANTLKTTRLTGLLYRIHDEDPECLYEGKCLVYLQRNSVSVVLSPGQLLLLSGFPESIPGPQNPEGFDARKYFAAKGIYLRLFVPSGNWRILSMNTSFSLTGMACRLRDRLLGILAKNGLQDQEFAVAAALLLGYVNDIDRELLQDYSATGAMHVLSVSGMHAGIVFLFLEFLLGFMNRKRGLVVAKAVIIICSIFAYALITGLSPPVLRAAVMLSLVVAGKTMKRQPDLINIVAASLILLLVANPRLMTDTGFQFSYLAVAGIVWMYKPIYDLYVTSWWLPDKIWSLLAVSLAAQLATFPLGIYNFHQFPNYFLLTNLLVVPLSSLIIYFGIFSLATGHIPVICNMSGEALSFLIRVLNGSIHCIEGLPWSATRGIFLTMPEILLIYAAIMAFFLFFTRKQKIFLFIFLVVLTGLQGMALFSRFQRARSKELVVYQVGRRTAVDFISGEADFLLTDFPLIQHDSYPAQVIVAHWSAAGVRVHWSGYLVTTGTGIRKTRISGLGLLRIGEFIQFNGKRIGFCPEKLPRGRDRRIQLDILLINNEFRQPMGRILEWFDPGMIILTESVPAWRRSSLVKEAEKAGIRIYDIKKSGAFVTKATIGANKCQ